MQMGPLGTVGWFIGGAMSELVFDGVFEGSDDQRLQDLWELILFQYGAQDSPNRLSILPLSIFYKGANTFSCFTGKAGEALSLIFVLHEICVELDTGSERDAHRIACFESLSSIFQICSSNGHFIPPPEAEAMLAACERFLVHYNWLSNFAIVSLRLDYNPTFKFHMLWHICYHAQFQNPKVGWCFQFEDFVGECIRAAKGCMHGSSLSIVGRKVLENFVLALQLALRHHE